LRTKRLALPPSQQRRAARQAGAQLARLVRRTGARHVAIYLSLAEELDTAPAIEAFSRSSCTLYVPVIAPGRAMRFVPLAPPFRRNRYGIAEPLARRAPLRLDLVVLPLVAFDTAGRRLGMGGGYYDRWLAAHPRAQRVGFGYAGQRVARVPADARDARLHAVVTENGVLRCTSRSAAPSPGAACATTRRAISCATA
jgi:5-formyltetrahydrofolate cyclo-ligase